MKLKKVTALLLATSMVLSSVSVGTFADDELIFEPEVSATTEAGEDEAYFGEEGDVVVNEQTATDDEAFFSDEVIDETVTDDVITEDENIADTANEVVDYAFEENADIYAAIENAEDTVSDEVSYDITGNMSYTGKYDGKPHGLDVSKAGVDASKIRFEHTELGAGVYLPESPTFTNAGIYPVNYQVLETNPSTLVDEWIKYPASEKSRVVIEAAPVSAKLKDATFKIGDTVPTLTLADYEFQGLVNDEKATDVFVYSNVTATGFARNAKWDGAKWTTGEVSEAVSGGKFKDAGKYLLGEDSSANGVTWSDLFTIKTVTDTLGSHTNYVFTPTTISGGTWTIGDSKREITVYWPEDQKYTGSPINYGAKLAGYTFTYSDESDLSKIDVGTYKIEITNAVDSNGITYTVTNPTHEWKITKAKAYAFVDVASSGLNTFEYGTKDPLKLYKKTDLKFYTEKNDTAGTDITTNVTAKMSGTAEFETTYTQYSPVTDYSLATPAPAKYFVRYKSGLESKNYEIVAGNDYDGTKTTVMNYFTLDKANVEVVPANITVPYGSEYVEPTYTLKDVKKDSGSSAALQHDIDAGLVNLSVFTSTTANDVSTKVTPKEAKTYYYTATLEDAVTGNHATTNFVTTTDTDTGKEKIAVDADKKYVVSKGEYTLKFSDYEGVYDGKPHGIVVEPEEIPSSVTIYYGHKAIPSLTDAKNRLTASNEEDRTQTTPITYVDPCEKLVYYFVDSDDLGSGLNGSNKVVIKDADKAAAEAVEKQIEEAVKKDAEGKYDPAKVKAAREAYDALTNDQKAMVDAYDVKALKEAEAEIAESAEADAKEVEDKIAALPDPENVTEADADAIMAAKDAYDNLSDDAKAKVSKDAKDKLDADIAALEGQEEADKKAAKAVEDEIDALPEASEAKASDKEAADKAVEDYNALTDAQKALVPADKVEKMNAVKAAADEAAEKEEAAKEEVAALDEAVVAVKAAKNGKDGKAAAEAAKEKYDALSDEAKALLTDEEIKAYEDTQKAYTKDYTFNSGEGVFRVLSNGEVTYLKPLHPENTWFVVPNQLKKNGFTYKVVKVSTKAFMGCTKATKIKIGKNVQSIGAYAFKNTPAMTKLIMLTSKLASGKVTNSFGGAGKEKGAKLTNEVPNGKSSAYESLFKGEGGMNAGAKFTEAN